MITFDNLFQQLEETRLHVWIDDLKAGLEKRFKDYTHGELNEWLELLEKLPKLNSSEVDLIDGVTIGRASDCSEQQRVELTQLLKTLHPWRKGPFELMGIPLNTEWRSDWKWDRIKNHIGDLSNQLVLDVGCGNGYHCWRMAGAGAKLVVGIDPSQKFLMQFQIMKHYIGERAVHLLPIGIEYMPETLGKQGFDTVFSMGVLYHRRSPIDHIIHLKQLIRPGGQLVLETLVVDGDEDTVFVPEGRYAQMRNVWFLPSTKALEKWCLRSGFKTAETVDINQTSLEEQRKTEWMTFHSLEDYVDVENNTTIEGHPPPKRAVIIAKL